MIVPHLCPPRRVLGTPNEECWPGIRQLPDYKPTFPQWSAQDLTRHVPLLDDTGLDLLKVSRRSCSPYKRTRGLPRVGHLF